MKGEIPSETIPILLKIKAFEVGKNWRVELAGVDVSNHLQEIRISAGVGDVTRVQLDLIGLALDLDGKVWLSAEDITLASERKPRPAPLEPLESDPKLALPE